jgi:hypothetical protein
MMHLMTILGRFAISVVLLSVSPAFAARVIHPHLRHICSGQAVVCCRRIPSKVEIPNAIGDAQANANVAPRQNIGCVSPPVIDKYAQSTATPPGCPGDTGPYN